MTIPRALYERILRHGEQTYPEESCGFVLADRAGAVVEVVPVTNAADRLRRERPDEFTRDARTGYVMDPGEQAAAMRAAESAGRTVRGLYHSHADVGAYFSDEDKARALPFGEPLFPEAVYLVADVRAGRARGMKAFVWDADTRDFVERPIEIV